VPALYCPRGLHGRQICLKHTKHYRINWGKGTLDIGTATRKGIGTYAVLPISYLFLHSSCRAGRPIYHTLQEFQLICDSFAPIYMVTKKLFLARDYGANQSLVVNAVIQLDFCKCLPIYRRTKWNFLRKVLLMPSYVFSSCTPFCLAVFFDTNTKTI
jgi:hypothetical protein